MVTPYVVEDVSASSRAPLETSGGDVDLDSLDLRDNELNKIASEPMVLSGSPFLMYGGSESVSEGKGSSSVS